ncbi:MAG: hypothetical protein RLO81_18710 [Fulvivirga sp.]|uniref:hypothetical protein n=1 Tax=Fulvivirga sp. TaxID=1931237 RepID=UPI0032ED9886
MKIINYLKAAFGILAVLPSIIYSQTVTPYAPELFSSSTSGAVCGFSNNGNLIYFVREDILKDKLFIYQAERNDNLWVNAQILPFSGVYNDMGGRLTPDGKKFYFTSDRPGGSSRENDVWNIWVSELTDNKWSKAKPLKEINDLGNECCGTPLDNSNLLFSSDNLDGRAWWIYNWDGTEITTIKNLTINDAWQWPSYYDQDLKLLFFNSMKRPDTHGKDDVYVSFLDNGKWASPLNIGNVVNTEIYEDGAILSFDKKILLFNQHTGTSSSRVMQVEWQPIYDQIMNRE